MSTTKRKELALDFQDFTGSSKPCVIEFNVHNGVHGIDLKDFDIADMEQKEVLLARNQKFVIKEVRQEQGQFYFKADLLTEKGYNKNIKLGKFGKITENPGIKANWKIKSIHSKDKLKERNINESDVENWIENGISVEQIKDNKYAFVTKKE